MGSRVRRAHYLNGPFKQIMCGANQQDVSCMRTRWTRAAERAIKAA